MSATEALFVRDLIPLLLNGDGQRPCQQAMEWLEQHRDWLPYPALLECPAPIWALWLMCHFEVSEHETCATAWAAYVERWVEARNRNGDYMTFRMFVVLFPDYWHRFVNAIWDTFYSAVLEAYRHHETPS